MTHPMPEINTLLKQVRLLHVMEQLPLRNRESIERKLAYPEFLSLVIQDEILGRDNKKLKARLKRAGVRYDKTLENFDFDFNSKNQSRSNTRSGNMPIYRESRAYSYCGSLWYWKKSYSPSHCPLRYPSRNRCLVDAAK